MYTVKLRHKDKSAKYRFFIVPEDGLAVLGMPDTELLSIQRVACKVISESHESRKFYLQAVEVSNSPRCRTNRIP